MVRTYTFFDRDAVGESVEFDDSGTVRKLVGHAFEELGYYEPFGMDTVTVYQGRFPYAHFTLDTERTCREEIQDPGHLCFAYHVPGLLYYAEGGWGHHMHELPNHPAFRQPVSLKLKFEKFDHTVVFEGTRSFREVLDLLMKVGYVDKSISRIKVWVMRDQEPNYTRYLGLHDSILYQPMTAFEEALPTDGIVTLMPE